MRTEALLLAIVAGAAPAVASVSTVTGSVTADNWYALYARIDGEIQFIGRNEMNDTGSSGGRAWTHAEQWSITGATDIYIAAWSDKAVAQGLLASFLINGETPLNSGDSPWRVVATGVTLGANSPAPSSSQINQFVLQANADNLWALPYVGGTNGVAPWGLIANVDQDARWMWAEAGGENPVNTINTGGNFDEYLIFHASTASIPAPSAALAVLGIAILPRRRR